MEAHVEPSRQGLADCELTGGDYFGWVDFVRLDDVEQRFQIVLRARPEIQVGVLGDVDIDGLHRPAEAAVSQPHPGLQPISRPSPLVHRHAECELRDRRAVVAHKLAYPAG